MKAPERSAAIAKALASEADGLPKDFAAQLAGLAETSRSARHSRWNDFALFGAFVAMIGVCVAGWFRFGPQEPGSVEWWGPIVSEVASEPWLLTSIAGVVIVQVLTFRRRTAT
jgi:hypothetical protein